jgi:polyribonucleotide nucleotidyltransferase
VIGTGGKVIQEMQRETGTEIAIEEVGEFGIIDIASANKDSIDAAIAKIKAIIEVPEIGSVYQGTIKTIQPFGAFVEFLPGKEALLHISEIDWKRIETMEETGLKEGDSIEVKLLDIDKRTGKLKLSHRVLLPKPEGYVEPPRRERPPRRDSRDRDGGRRPDRGERSDRSERRSYNPTAPQKRTEE